MKTYTETIARLAQQSFDRYMQGSFVPMQDCDTALVAFVYERSVEEVDRAVFYAFEHKKSAYYDSVTG